VFGSIFGHFLPKNRHDTERSKQKLHKIFPPTPVIKNFILSKNRNFRVLFGFWKKLFCKNKLAHPCYLQALKKVLFVTHKHGIVSYNGIKIFAVTDKK